MAEHSRAYNSVWQLRADAWCRLEEAANRLNRADAPGKPKERYTGIVTGLLSQLTPLEPYWAYPGFALFTTTQRLFAAGEYDKFARAVSRINHALTTDSYRRGVGETAAIDDRDLFRTDPRQLEAQPSITNEQPYFEVLVVESMTEAQERALRNAVQLAPPRRRVRL